MMGASAPPPGPIEPFVIGIEQPALDDLRARINNTRWPDQVPGVGWSRGTELGYLREIVRYWAEGFDWRAQERELNHFRQFRIKLDGIWIHLGPGRARTRDGPPAVL